MEHNKFKAFKECFLKNLTGKLFACSVIAFALGLLLAFFLPPFIIAVVEALLLIILCWCIYRC